MWIIGTDTGGIFTDLIAIDVVDAELGEYAVDAKATAELRQQPLERVSRMTSNVGTPG